MPPEVPEVPKDLHPTCPPEVAPEVPKRLLALWKGHPPEGPPLESPLESPLAPGDESSGTWGAATTWGRTDEHLGTHAERLSRNSLARGLTPGGYKQPMTSCPLSRTHVPASSTW